MENVKEVYDSAHLAHPLIEELRALVRYKDLLVQFVSRALKTRYKRSLLGVAWTLLNPLFTMIILTLVFSVVFKFEIKFYPVYVLSGLIIWNFFSSTTSQAMGDMIFSGYLFNRIYVPKSVFAVSAIGTGLVNLGLSLIPLFAISLILGVEFHTSLLTLPLSVLILAIFSLGLGLVLATAAVYFGDMIPVYEVLLTIWMYATPIIYPIEIIPEPWSILFRFNPMLYMVEIFRQPLFAGQIPQLSTWLIASLFAIGTLLLGSWIFTAKSNEYAYRI